MKNKITYCAYIDLNLDKEVRQYLAEFLIVKGRKLTRSDLMQMALNAFLHGWRLKDETN